MASNPHHCRRREAMELFPDGGFVRLESRVMTGKYVHADADWQRISLRRNAGGADPALNSVWRVQRWVNPEKGDDTYVALQNAAFGRYLSFSMNPARRGLRTTQINCDGGVGVDLNSYLLPWMWTVERLPDPADQDYATLRYDSTWYLRANAGSYFFFHRFRNNTCVVTTVSDLDASRISKMMHWKVHHVAASPVPRVLPLALEDDEAFDFLVFESGLFPHPARTIRHALANDEGEFDGIHHNWSSFAFNCSSVNRLRNELRRLQDWNEDFTYTLCIQPGSHGRLMPLVTYTLPISLESMNIVVLKNPSPAAAALRYPAPPGSDDAVA